MLGATSAVDDGNTDTTGGAGLVAGSHNLERLPPSPKPACPSVATWSNAVGRMSAEAGSGDIMYGLGETPMNGADPLPLDETVDRLEASYGGTTEEIARNTGSFEGVETREVTFNLIRDGKKAPTRSRIFYQDGYAVQAVVSADNELDVEAAERFLSSVARRH